MPPYQNPELLALYESYTGGGATIGAELTQLAVAAGAGDPLLVTTSTDLALYPGSGRDPEVLPFRVSTRGFKELAAVSHLGPALGSLVNMRSCYDDAALWRGGAERLRHTVRVAREANTAVLWRDAIAVQAYRGRETAIAAMVDYACAMTEKFLDAVLQDERKLTAAFLRDALLDAKGGPLGASIPLNHVMIATFFLVGLDFSYRLMRWLDGRELDWESTMVLVCGKQGRPTSGVTLGSNSVAQIIVAASDQRLKLDRLYIAPHAETFAASGAKDLASVREAEAPLRRLWAYTRAISDLGETMFAGYARFAPAAIGGTRIDAQTQAVAEMPRIAAPDDFLSMVTRLRVVLEDPRQLLTGCVTDYAAQQLRAAGCDVDAVVVPGLDGIDYARACGGA